MNRERVPAGQPDSWRLCLRCGQPLTSWVSQADGFGLECSLKLTRDERRRMVEAARRVRELEGEWLGASRRERVRFVVRDRLGMFRRH